MIFVSRFQDIILVSSTVSCGNSGYLNAHYYGAVLCIIGRGFRRHAFMEHRFRFRLAIAPLRQSIALRTLANSAPLTLSVRFRAPPAYCASGERLRDCMSPLIARELGEPL